MKCCFCRTLFFREKWYCFLFPHWLRLLACLLWAFVVCLQDVAACCHFGVDLHNQLDRNFFFCSRDGTPRSFLTCFTLFLLSLLLFSWTIVPIRTSLSVFVSQDKFLWVQLLAFTRRILSPNLKSSELFKNNLVSCVSRNFTSIF